MEAKTLLVFLLSAVYIGAALGQVATMCQPREKFLECGCPKTCRDPFPECKGVCRTGCYCEEGQVRNETGQCIKLADCPPHKYKLPLEDVDCPEFEEYRICEACNKTCENPNPICPAQCSRGCFCKEGLFRDSNGKCVTLEKCSKNIRSNEIGYVPQPIPYRINCGPYQRYTRCGTCEKTCSNPNPVCTNVCRKGCFCEKGYVRSPSGDCVKLEECPSGL